LFTGAPPPHPVRIAEFDSSAPSYDTKVVVVLRFNPLNIDPPAVKVVPANAFANVPIEELPPTLPSATAVTAFPPAPMVTVSVAPNIEDSKLKLAHPPPPPPRESAAALLFLCPLAAPLQINPEKYEYPGGFVNVPEAVKAR
jgi:hypothetical protein